ncbi:MAG: hypothetical protein M9895_00265 [Aquamicrobium sp.]|uniref:hypothetical protein n=1 Tax=Aquamicrobium sp. TaxID=1872579 RepID=UPI00349EF1B3|nr:hypothetical protein [Aquamicrobium sp.]
MNAMTREPTLEEQLARAERDLVCASMIDDWTRCQRETAECERHIASIKRQIAERDERQHIENACASLGDRHAG